MKIWGKLFTVIGAIAAVLAVIGAIKKPSSVYKDKPEEQNPMQGKKVRFVADDNEKENADGVRGHLEAIGNTNHKAGIYEKYIKRFIDITKMVIPWICWRRWCQIIIRKVSARRTRPTRSC